LPVHFDAAAMLKWIARLRDLASTFFRVGLLADQPRDAVAHAKRCGVRLGTGWHGRPAWRQLFALSAPDAGAQARRRAERHLGEIAPHFFSFAESAHRARGASGDRAPHRHRSGRGFRSSRRARVVAPRWRRFPQIA
jgi:hypothetical protein